MIQNYEIELIGKLILAFVFGILIGFNREQSGKPAGVRTQMLICVGSALLAGISIHLGDKYFVEGSPRPDPARLMAQIVAGIGFVGAGVILKSQHRISGVTTAATIWVTAAIGIAIGSGFYLSAIITTICVLLLEPLAFLQYKYGLKTYAYVLKTSQADFKKCRDILEKLQLKYQVRRIDHEVGQFMVFSSEEKKRKLLQRLDEDKITFDAFEADE